jgi:hypothetical protein
LTRQILHFISNEISLLVGRCLANGLVELPQRGTGFPLNHAEVVDLAKKKFLPAAPGAIRIDIALLLPHLVVFRAMFAEPF